MQPFDVAVVGSGPAGASCALRLAREGARVALIDEREFPRAKVCGEYLNLGTVRELHDLGLGERLEPIAAPLHGLRLFVRGEVATFPIAPAAWSIARTVLDTHIRNAALDAGAQPVAGRLSAIDAGAERVTLHLRDRDGERKSVAARYVVGADGMHSAVARASGLTKAVTSRRFALGGHHPDLPTQGWVEIYSSPQGYLALNPLDERACNAVFVLARDRLARAKDDLHGELARFSQALTGGAHVVDDVRYDEGRRGIGPLAHRTVRPTGHRVLLAGDAAAFIDPFTGQGMYLALTGGRLAAAALTEALASPARERAAWAQYERNLGSALRDREMVALMMRAFVGWNVATKRATRALRRRPGDFAFLIDAVCGKVRANPLALAAAVGAALR